MNWHEPLLDSAAHLLARSLGRLARTLSFSRVESRGFQLSQRRRIYYFNHTSHADTVLLWATMPKWQRRKMRFVAAKDYWETHPFRRFVAERCFRAIFLERQPKTREERQQQVSEVISKVGPSEAIVLSPEGTRGDGTQVAPFKSGIYYLCQNQPDFELVPVYLKNLHRLLPKGAFLPRPCPCRVVFGEPFSLDPGESRQDFLERARNRLLELERS
ncbi:1-acyl-sn-glycerol-3-phosphate acyltransferase [bacterium]|nr:1-acyl-sn-glycerol-3-phosphate acyltransferase [bacterium]